MLTQQRVLRSVVEIMFMLLGGIVVWLGFHGDIFFDRRRVPWIVLSVAVVLWGLRALYKPGAQSLGWERWIRGVSLTLLGFVMLAISRVAFMWVGRLLAVAGILLALRGLLGLVLVLRPH
jgi:hypothetical protein